MSKRRLPHELFKNQSKEYVELCYGNPCSVLALDCALSSFYQPHCPYRYVNYDKEGYCTLQNMNKAIRGFFKCKYHYYKKVERMTLNQIMILLTKERQKAIVCCLGHYVFVDGTAYGGAVYYSYFDNMFDEVVALWILEEVKNETR